MVQISFLDVSSVEYIVIIFTSRTTEAITPELNSNTLYKNP